MKKITSFFLSVMLILTSVIVPASFAYADVSGLSSSEEYLTLLSDVQQQMKNRNEQVSCSVVSTDGDFDSLLNNSQLQEELYNEFYYDLFTENTSDEQLGDYLFHSIYKMENLSLTATQDAQGVKLTFTGKFNYFTTKAQEDEVARFAAEFNKHYIPDGSTEYATAKAIYDFIVRYINYDNALYEDSKNNNSIWPRTSERYKASHSVYGAVFSDVDGVYAYDLTSSSSVTGEEIVNSTAQGLSVCEGYAKLFYYLCTMNGIECHIVDGNYVAGQTPDAHEWNYVRFKNDENPANNNTWFLVDATFASQKSTFELDDTNYNYFLRGSESEAFDKDHHQQPYANYGRDEQSSDEYDKKEKEQIYDWVNDEKFTVSSYDYQFAPEKLIENADITSYIIRRTTDYGDGEKVLDILFNSDGMFEISYDEGGNVVLESVDGFAYNGHNSKFEIVIPYLIDGVYEITGDVSNIKACKDAYTITVNGADGTKLNKTYPLVPLSMSDEENYNEEKSKIIHSVEYTGENILSSSFLSIVDSYNNALVENRDYTVSYYDGSNKKLDSVVEIGRYTVRIDFSGNYCGRYSFDLSVTPLNLDNDTDETTYIFPYIPVGTMNVSGTVTPDYFLSYIVSGSAKFDKGVDFTADKSNGKLTFGATGYITIHGINNSNSHCIGTKKVKYMYGNPNDESTKFDLNRLKTEMKIEYADTNTTNVYYYTGSQIIPTKFDNLDDYIVRGVDYEITGYSNNINAGTATVTIKGINGCKGTVSFKFIINKVGLSNSTVNITLNGSTVNATVKLGNKTLVEGTDYTKTVTTTSTGYKVSVTGKGNYTGGRDVNVIVSGGGSAAKNGWKKISGKWYYYKNGTALKWRQKIGGKYYYFNGAGVMQTGWIKGGCWMYAKSDGALVTGWQKIGGKWYWFKADGSMVTGWQKISGKWYFFNGAGAMITGWLKSGGKWYWFNSSGAMVANTSVRIGRKTYRFNASGACTNP